MSLAHVTRLILDTKTQGTVGCVTNHVSNRREHRPQGGSIRKDLEHERKALFSWTYQSLSAQAATGIFLFNRLEYE